MPKGVFSTHC